MSSTKKMSDGDKKDDAGIPLVIGLPLAESHELLSMENSDPLAQIGHLIRAQRIDVFGNRLIT